MKTELAELHLVLMFPGLVLPADKARLLLDLNELTGGRFDGDPVLLPVPDEAPAEIPRLVLMSKARSESLELTKAHLALKLVLTPQAAEPLDPALALDLGPKLLRFTEDRLRAAVHRVGSVTVWFFETQEATPAASIRRRYLVPAVPGEAPHSAEVHSLEKPRVGGYACNFWTRVRSVDRKGPEGAFPAASILFDVNTLPEVPCTFSEEQTRTFISATHDLMRARLDEHLHLGEVS
jgi:hypothetical protein